MEVTIHLVLEVVDGRDIDGVRHDSYKHFSRHDCLDIDCFTWPYNKLGWDSVFLLMDEREPRSRALLYVGAAVTAWGIESALDWLWFFFLSSDCFDRGTTGLLPRQESVCLVS